MAAAILKSEIADKASVMIVKAFVAMQRFLASNAQVLQRLDRIEYKIQESDQKFEDRGRSSVCTVFSAIFLNSCTTLSAKYYIHSAFELISRL